MAALAELKAILGLDSKGYKAGMKDAQGVTASFQRTLANVGRTIAAAFSVSAIVRATRAVIDYGSKMSDSAYQTGVGVEAYQALAATARKAGAEVDELRNALIRARISQGEALRGESEYVEAFADLGITLEQLSQMNADQVFEALSRALVKSNNSAASFAAAFRLLGTRAGPRLLEVMRDVADDGLQGIIDKQKELGQVIDAEGIAKLDEYADKIAAFKTAAMKNWAAVVNAVLPDPVTAEQEQRAKDMALSAYLTPGDKTTIERPIGGEVGSIDVMPRNFDEYYGLRRDEFLQQAKEQLAIEKEIADMEQSIAQRKMQAEEAAAVAATAETEAAEKRLKAQRRVDAETERSLSEIERNHERIKDLETRDLNVRGNGVRTSSLAEIGGYVGGNSRAGLGVNDRQMKLGQEQLSVAKEIRSILDDNRRLSSEIVRLQSAMAETMSGGEP